MKFLNRDAELERLDRLAQTGGLAVLYGRRRIGKTRLLVEWVRRHRGLYAVADLSAPDVQRRYLSTAVAQALPGFSDVEYPDWSSLFSRLGRDAKTARFRGPLVLDELPYLVLASPELPSVLQRFVDHDAKDAGLVVALSGSSQRMMQGLVLSRNAPLFGRAREILPIGPLHARHLHRAFPDASLVDLIQLYSAWGGVPWYWELAQGMGSEIVHQIDQLVLDSKGPLHHEPDRLLLEETPSALEVRPLLDAIGLGAHRVSEIAGRLGRPATSLSRPLARLIEMGLVRREVPFGEPEQRSKKGIYRIDDPFFRMWFRVVAPRRGLLATAPPSIRRQVLEGHLGQLRGQAWEELCRAAIPSLGGALAKLGPWGPASRWWSGGAPEWDIVSESLDGKRLLLGEAKWSDRPLREPELGRQLQALESRPPPTLATSFSSHAITRVLFVPALEGRARLGVKAPSIVTAKDVLRT
jgi:uncharacterized protein